MTDEAPVTSPPEQASLVEDLIDIWFTPSKVFARRANGGYWAPFFVVAVLMCALYFASIGMMQGVFDAQVALAVSQAMDKNPNLTADQLDGMRSMMEASMKYGGLVFMPVILLLLGLVVMIAGKVMGGEISFGKGVMIGSLAYVPRVLEMLLVSVQGLIFDTASWTGRYQFSWGVGRFLDPEMPQGIYNFVGRIDIFTIWITILIAIGLVSAAKVEKSKAYMGAGLVWLLGSLPAVWQIIQGQ
ncbi:MAG: YIP1 family protein [Gemmatimonadaceae bacterium]|nr:YIP1 family protein [Gemmatimonadaceae bacterium]